MADLKMDVSGHEKSDEVKNMLQEKLSFQRRRTTNEGRRQVKYLFELASFQKGVKKEKKVFDMAHSYPYYR